MSACRVLVVEDDAGIRGLVKVLAARAGYTTTLTRNGVEAIEALKRDSFGVVVLDLMMPLASGYDVIMHIRDNALTVPVVVMTAVVKGIELERLDPRIVKSIVRKPFDLQALETAIDSACHPGEAKAEIVS
jgi:CheY-like chemotaxis protein